MTHKEKLYEKIPWVRPSRTVGAGELAHTPSVCARPPIRAVFLRIAVRFHLTYLPAAAAAGWPNIPSIFLRSIIYRGAEECTAVNSKERSQTVYAGPSIINGALSF